MFDTATPSVAWDGSNDLNRVGIRAKVANLHVTCDPFATLDLGDSSIASVVQKLRRVSQSDLPILLHGETGSGKELFARAIHDASPRRNGRFVAVNCASIPEGLIESELFGYRAGAFTGASSRGAKGLIQQSEGGTLFLDEIGDMPLAMQSRLLRVLAEKEVRPIGSETTVKTDFRVVSATHRDLRARGAEGLFRDDLLFRLHGLAVTLLPLRSRTDIVALARRLLKTEHESFGRQVTLSGCAENLICHLPWPGNVRQLKQVLTAAAWLTDASIVRRVDIQMALETGGSVEQTPTQEAAAISNEPAKTLVCDKRSALLLSLKRNRWNVSRTAGEFKIARTTIYRRMARLGIVQPHLLEDGN